MDSFSHDFSLNTFDVNVMPPSGLKVLLDQFLESLRNSIKQELLLHCEQQTNVQFYNLTAENEKTFSTEIE